MSTPASLMAYAAIISHLPKKRANVFYSIGHSGGSTIRESCQHLNAPYNTVSARIFELAESGLIKNTGFVRGGQSVWIPSRPEEVDELRAERKARRPFETEIFESSDHWTDGQIRVEVAIPRDVFDRLKKPVRVRFL